jgi:ankyrin repeat protein
MSNIAKTVLSLFVMTVLASAAVSENTKLPDAAMQGDKAAVAALLKQGMDVNSAQGDGSTALHWAAYHGDLEMTKALLKAGASVKAATRIGSMTPLSMACQNGNPSVIEALLSAGANAREVNTNGTTVLMTAAAAGSADAVKLLLDRGADVNAKDNTNGQTALMFAASRNSAGALKVLIERGADPNVLTKVSALALVQADENGNPLPPPSADDANRGGGGRGTAAAGGTAGGRGARGGRSLGATSVGGLTALHFAAREGQMDAVRELVTGGANVNLQSGSDKTPPMTEAIINGHLDIAKFFLEHGADPKIANADGLTALYATIDIRWRANAWYPQPTIAEEKTDYIDFMQAVLDRGADVNARLVKGLWYRKFRYGGDWVDPSGATPFWRAAQANDVKALHFLAAHGADPNIPTNRKVTPLMVAAGVGFEYQLTNIAPDSRLATVKYLVDELGADVNAKDDMDYTTLHGTAYVGDNDVIKYLVSKGANVKARAKGRLGGTQGADTVPEGTGDTVADMANGPREKSLLHPETVKLLESLGSENSHDCRSTGCVNNTKQEKPPVKP